MLVTRARLPACAPLMCLPARSATPCFDSRLLTGRVARQQPKHANSPQRLTFDSCDLASSELIPGVFFIRMSSSSPPRACARMMVLAAFVVAITAVPRAMFLWGDFALSLLRRSWALTWPGTLPGAAHPTTLGSTIRRRLFARARCDADSCGDAC